MNTIREIQFVDLNTEAPIVTITGHQAQILLRESDLIQTVAEIGGQANPNVLVVPIGDMGLGRQILFANILRGVPVGKVDRYGNRTFYPLGPEEEQNITRVVSGARNRNIQLNRERANAVYETMRFLSIPDDLIDQMLVFDEVYDEYTPEYTREDQIDNMLETHVLWLYITGQKTKLTPNELKKAKEFFDDVEASYKKDMEEVNRLEELERKRAQARFKRDLQRYRSGFAPYGRYYENNNNDDEESYANYKHREVEDRYTYEKDRQSYEPPEVDTTGEMNTREFERWLRTVFFKKAPLALNTLHLNTLFNENRRANRSRVNRSNVIYYKNNTRNNNNKTRKGKNKNNNNKKKPNTGNGSTW